MYGGKFDDKLQRLNRQLEEQENHKEDPGIVRCENCDSLIFKAEKSNPARQKTAKRKCCGLKYRIIYETNFQGKAIIFATEISPI